MLAYLAVGAALFTIGVYGMLHRRNIMDKLGLHRTPDLIRYAVNKGFSKLSAFRERNANPP